MATQNVGRVVRVIGPVVDVEFEKGVPPIYNAVHILDASGEVPIDVIRGDRAAPGREPGALRRDCCPRTAMVRGMQAIDTGGPITVPVGPETLGRVLNVIGAPVDEMGPVHTQKRYPIHRPAPSFEEQSTKAGDVRDRHQGDRPDRAVPARRARSGSSAARASARP